MKVGSFISISDGLYNAAVEAYHLGATAYMIFSDSPRSPRRASINTELAELAHKLIPNIVVHAPYTINLASSDYSVVQRSIKLLKEELERTKQVKSNHLVLHPGCYVKSNKDIGISQIAEALNLLLNDESPIVCLETMAGKGSEIGGRFYELKEIIDRVERKDKIAVCFDTCHVFDAGYDLNKDTNKVLEEFDNIIGLDKIKVVHVNGSLNTCGSRKDRHASLGSKTNNIKLKAFRSVVNRPELEDSIFILETPDPSLYSEEIELLKCLRVKEGN